MHILQQLKRTVGASLRTLVTVVAVLVVVIPAAAWAGHQFTDVPNSNTFHGDIDWMSDNGVTKGCNPPTNNQYCPDDFVTREQMAAFMHRLETEGVFLPVDGKDSAAFEQFGGTIPSGTTLTGNWYAAPSNGNVTNSRGYFEMTFPTAASAPANIGSSNSNMAAGTTNGFDNDPQCTGTADNPTAPAGTVCWYVGFQTGLNALQGFASSGDQARGARLTVRGNGSGNQYASGSWAYTAP
jgi:hypothetical protein